MGFIPGDSGGSRKGGHFWEWGRNRRVISAKISLAMDKINIVLGGFGPDGGFTRFFNKDGAVIVPVDFSSRRFMYFAQQ